MKPEAKVKKRLAEIMDASPFHPLRVPTVMGAMTRAGTSDVLACHHGRFLAIEVKATARDHPTPRQIRFLTETLAAGGLPMVVHAGNVEHMGTLLGYGDAESFAFASGWVRPWREFLMYAALGRDRDIPAIEELQGTIEAWARTKTLADGMAPEAIWASWPLVLVLGLDQVLGLKGD
ncbi:MAG: hypothetical protein LBP92_11320 [Deltaproteobacteria bacterium]|nr:hypothetical protein [Deltaproteobacteria bacterium]